MTDEQFMQNNRKRIVELEKIIRRQKRYNRAVAMLARAYSKVRG